MAKSAPDASSGSRLDDLVRGSQAALRLVETLKHLNSLQRIFARHSHYDPNQPSRTRRSLGRWAMDKGGLPWNAR